MMNQPEIVVDNFAGGNAVCPLIPAALVRANLPKLCNEKEAA